MRENDQMAYLKNLMAQYLVCAEEAPKQHMERAVMTVLGFTDSERERVAKKRQENSRVGFRGVVLADARAIAAWFSHTRPVAPRRACYPRHPARRRRVASPRWR